MNKPPIPDVPKLPNRIKEKEDYRKFCKGELVTTKELANIFGVTKQAVEKWVSAGLKSLGKAGRFNVYDSAYVTQWKIDKESFDLRQQLIEATTEDESGMSGFDAKRRKEIAQALTAELDLVIKREQVANIEYLFSVFDDSVVQMRSNFVSLPARLSGLLSHKNEEDVYKILDKEISELLDEVSNYKERIKSEK